MSYLSFYLVHHRFLGIWSTLTNYFPQSQIDVVFILIGGAGTLFTKYIKYMLGYIGKSKLLFPTCFL